MNSDWMAMLDWAELLAIALVAAVFALWGRIFLRAGYSLWYVLTLLVPLFNLYMMGKLIVKAGYSVAWILLVLVPGINVVLLLMLAFSEWPSDRQLKQQMKMAYGPRE